MHDWNWFFSSFCQSAAALIGIIAAFIISRLLGLGEKINLTISTFDDFVIESKRIKNSIANRDFYWYIYTMVRYNDGLKEEIKKGAYNNIGRAEILKKIYDSYLIPYKNQTAVFEAFYEIERLHKLKSSKPSILDNIEAINNPPIPEIPPINRLKSEKEAINLLEVESKTLVEHFTQNLQNLKSFDNTIKPLKRIIFFLIIAFPLTVIYPLHFMPVDTTKELTLNYNIKEIFQSFFSLKFILLTIFLITIESVFIYFLILTSQFNKSLKSAINSNSETYRDIKNYSNYFVK